MRLRKTVKIAAVLLLTASLLTLWSCKKDGVSGDGIPFYDKEGGIICRIDTADSSKWKLEDKGFRFYVQYALNEAVELISDTDNCTAEEAEKKLFGGDYAIYTNFDETAYNGLKSAYVENAADVDYTYGGAVSDNSGRLLAIYSQSLSEDSRADYSTEKQKVYGLLTPVGVYAPALESKNVNWSSKISDDVDTLFCDNVKSPDPEAETAVLKEYGVKNSLDFLKEKFNINLSLPQEDSSAEKLVKGDFAEKLSPVQLVGIYQFLANGGYVYETRSVEGIYDSKGNVMYKSEDVYYKVTERSTADILNRLLQSAIVHGSVDSSAYCDNLSAGGRSGSGEEGSWFVGFTPQYVCAVWHGNELSYNSAPDLFSFAVSSFEHDYSLDYPTAQKIKATLYCTESGLSASDSCKKTSLGYYESDSLPKECGGH